MNKIILVLTLMGCMAFAGAVHADPVKQPEPTVPTVKLPETLKVQPGRLLLIKADTTCKTVAWIMYSDNADLIPIDPPSNTQAIFASPVAGVYKVVAVTCAGDVMSAPAVCKVVVGTPGPPLVVTPMSLPDGSAGTVYTQTLTVTGGTPPYNTFQVTNFNGGTTGLAASCVTTTAGSGTFTISGTASAAGVVSFSIQVVDSQQATLTKSYTINFGALPPEPTDPLYKALKAAYQSDTSTTKAASKDKLASLYKQAATTTINQANLTNTQLLQMLHQDCCRFNE